MSLRLQIDNNLSVLVARDLCVGYERDVVLDGVAFSMAPGESIALLGPNGAGKTTLLRALAGVLVPARGSVTLDGRRLADWRRRDLALQLAYVPQEYALLFPFRVLEVVLMGRYSRQRFGASESGADLAAARMALERVDLWSRHERRFDELSGGERRRVLLAQALCQETRFLLLDEPTASLDIAHAEAFLEALAVERRQRQLGVLIATHDLAAAARIADQAVLLGGGGIVTRGATLDVLASPECERAFASRLYVGRVPGTERPFCVPA